MFATLIGYKHLIEKNVTNVCTLHQTLMWPTRLCDSHIKSVKLQIKSRLLFVRSEISNSLQAYLWYDHRFLNFGEREPWYPKEIPERIVTSCRHSTKVCGPTVSTSYSTDQIGTCLIRVATAYSNYCCCFKFQNWSWNTKMIRRPTKRFFYFKQSHRSCWFWWLLNWEWWLYFEYKIQSTTNMSHIDNYQVPLRTCLTSPENM